MKHHSLLTVAMVALGVLVASAACTPMGEPALRARALDYLRVANDMEATKDFLTPRMQDAISSAGRSIQSSALAIPGVPYGLNNATNEQLAKITSDNLSVRTQGKWGRVRVTMQSRSGLQRIDTVWVKVRGQWYLFAGTDGEKSEYGKPPILVD